MAEIEWKGEAELAAALDEIAAKLTDAATLKVGFFETAKYPDGTPVALIAATQNYGAPKRGIPPRPFFSEGTVAKHQHEWPEAIKDALIEHKYDVREALNDVGEGIRGQLQQAIVDTIAPPLSPITLMLRKMVSEDPTLVVTGRTVGEAARRVERGESSEGVSTKPLIFTSQMINSADFEVE